MIHIDLNWSDGVAQARLGLLVFLLIIYFWTIFRKPGARNSPRFWVKFSLHILLSASLLGFVLKPYWDGKSKSGTALIFGKDIPAVFFNQVRDSLQTAAILDINKPDFNQIDSLILVGEDFPQSIFEGIMLSEYQPRYLQWIPFDQTRHIKNLSWKGILRQGEIQRISGVVNENKSGLLKLKYGNVLIDSLLVQPGQQTLDFSFPAFSNNRTVMTLELEGKAIDTIRFYTRKPEPLKFRFLLQSPDFETRTLATWLGKIGHSVDYISGLSKNMNSEVKINEAGEPDILIVDPQNLGNELTKKYLDKGKSVLVLNLENPSTDIHLINKSLGSHFQIKADRKDSTAKNTFEKILPYRFVPALYQIPLSKFPVLAEKKLGIVAVSLLNETFPMILSGDSLTYSKVWSEIVAGLRPPMKSNIDLQSPVYQDIDYKVILNNFMLMPDLLKVGQDSIFLSPSPINPRTVTATLAIEKSGWVSFGDSLELYVGAKTEPGYNSAYLTDFLRKYQVYQSNLQKSKPSDKFSNSISRTNIPDWVWFALIVCALLAIWIEEKV